MEPLRRLLVLLAYTLGGGIAVFCILGTFMTPFMGMSVKESRLFIPLGLFFAVLTWAIVKAINWIFQHGEQKDAKRHDVTIKDERG